MEATEKLYHGMYCEVTREQSIELLLMEGCIMFPRNYVDPIFKTFERVYALNRIHTGIVLSGIKHGDYITEIPYSDFKQRLFNTVNNK